MPRALHFDVHSFPNWFAAFSSDVTGSDPSGRFIFAHFLMPHAPYVYDSECLLHERWFLPWFMTELLGVSQAEFEALRSEHYPEYFAQVDCLLTKLDELLTAIDNSPGFKDASIVIHGDHGARLSSGQRADHLTDRDMIDNYATLFAVRGPGVTPSYDERVTTVQRLVAEVFGQAKGDAVLTVTADTDVEGVVVEKLMPSYRSGFVEN